MSIQIVRIIYSQDEFRKPVGHENITEGCKLLPYYDEHHRDRKRVVFMPGSSREQNVGDKYIDGPFRDCWEPQPGFIFQGCELKSVREQMMSMAGPEMLTNSTDDAVNAEELTAGHSDEPLTTEGV